MADNPEVRIISQIRGSLGSMPRFSKKTLARHANSLDPRYRARRENTEISTGSVTRMTSGASIMPVTTTTASGFCT